MAEDAVQEAFCRAIRYHRTYNKDESLDNWFKSILYNTINAIKGEERDRGVVYRDDLENMPYVAQDKAELPPSITKLFKRASTRDQEILSMRFFFGFKTREIHELLNVSHDVVRDVIRRFKEKLTR
jgi:RNA polymerase sigma factor (sigma-70 family)